MKKPPKKLTATQMARVQRLCAIRGLASRPDGVTYKELKHSEKTLIKDFKELMADGVLFRRTASGGLKSKGARFFTNIADADAFFKKTRPTTRAAARVTGPAHLDIEPDLSKAKYTIAAPPVRTLRTNTHSHWG